MRESGAAMACAVLGSLAVMRIATGEQTSGNPVIAAADAFGLTVGLESTGIYNPASVRGFDPQAAGNARIDGLYFDQQGGLSDRIIESSTIRVGIGEIGFAFPAPTGIVDYQLRHAAGGEPTGTMIVEAGPYDGKAFSIDGSVPVAPRLQVQGGASFARPSSGNLGYTANSVDVGAVPSWTPSDRLTVRVLVDWQKTTTVRTPPQYLPGGDVLPAHVRPGFLGQYWALQEADAENLGATFDAQLSAHWSLAGGLFRSVSDIPVSYADLYVSMMATGLADHILVGVPDQRTGSDSGEVRLTGRFKTRQVAQTMTLMARGRYALAHYGGADAVDVGQAPMESGSQVARPDFLYQPETRDATQLASVGVAYEAQYSRWGRMALGAQKEFYEKSVEMPEAGNARRTDDPARLYASGSALLSAHAVAYIGYTQGFEDSGVVPGSAANRGAILPTTRSWQIDGGIRYPVTSMLSLTAGAFEVSKPYFNLDADNVDRMLGWQRAAGLEMSLAGQVLPGLYVNAGALIGHVQVIGANLAAQGIGTAAVGQPRDMTQVNAVYTLPALPSLSLDIGLKQMSAVPATVDDGLEVRGWSVVDLGNRWQFKLHGASATLRVQVRNLFDVNPWSIGLTPGLTQFAPRTLVAYLTVAI
jgi:iron complex outermembrane recepter protein